ncbi:unnamed protein product [Cyprideis torosa]|nr:unnamed protein product [Cyprideis torosa]CAG0885146.1 unnamed protein product [Cyprideis torosa]
MFHNHTLEELVELDFLRPPRTVDPLVFFPSEFETHTPKEISKHVIFMHNYWRWSIPISFLYVLGIFYAQQAMKDRKPVKLKTSLILWNAGLAIFSFWGGFRTAIFMIYDAYHMGWGPTICYTTYNCKGCETAPIWVYLFAYSKVVELGDTLFIVLRKRPLIFLHWYHHVTVLCYTWYAVGTVTAGGTYFIAANFSVHFLMYSYYAIRAAGFNVPR